MRRLRSAVIVDEIFHPNGQKHRAKNLYRQLPLIVLGILLDYIQRISRISQI
jgi:hypothetical protein